MQLLRLSLSSTSPLLTGCVATLGKFDGLHQGHKAVIQKLTAKAQALSLPSVVIVTEPQPDEYFQPGRSVRLTSLREKSLLLASLDVDYLAVLPFNAQLAGMSAETFIYDVLREQLQVRCFIAGDDSRFGYQRRGDADLLRQLADDTGIVVEETDSLLNDSIRISSTAIREALQQGDIGYANSLFGHDYFIAGRVVHGDKRGRTLGFPTANVHLRTTRPPLQGTFVTTVRLRDEMHQRPAIANIGQRPTFNDAGIKLEVHLLNFNATLYGQCLQVFFQQKLRDEKKFAALSDLRQQIDQDVQQAYDYFKLSPDRSY